MINVRKEKKEEKSFLGLDILQTKKEAPIIKKIIPSRRRKINSKVKSSNPYFNNNVDNVSFYKILTYTKIN